MRRLAYPLLLLALVVDPGCGDEVKVMDGSSPQPDASRQELDMAMPDAATPDAAIVDLAVAGPDLLSPPCEGDQCDPGQLAVGDSVIAIALDANDVYYAEMADCKLRGAIKRVPKGGGAVTLVAAAMCPMAVAVDRTSAYFIDVATGSVWSAPKGGGPATRLASGESLYDKGVHLAVDDKYAYFGARSALRRVPLGGGPVSTLVTITGTVMGIAVDAGAVYFARFSDKPDGQLLALPPGAMAPTVLATGHSLPFGVAIDAKSVFFTDEGAPTRVMSVGRDGQNETILVASPGPGVLGIAADATYVYWADKSTVHRVAKDGTGATALPLPSWGSVAVDQAAVYAGSRTGVFRLAK